MVSTNEKINIAGITLTGTGLLPFLLPIQVDILTGSLITLVFSVLGATLFMNKGSKWIVNILAQKEPLLFGAGLTTLTLGIRYLLIYPTGRSLTNIQSAMITLSIITGLTLITTSIISRYTEIIDI